VCAGCHAVIDPLGFALENFDQTGRYRTVDQSTRAVDVSGTFPDGTGFKALGDFKARITSRPERFAAALTEKLLTYGLGRGLGPSDMPTVRAIVRQASSSNYRLSAVVLGIATSTPFQMRRTLDESVTAVAAK